MTGNLLPMRVGIAPYKYVMPIAVNPKHPPMFTNGFELRRKYRIEYRSPCKRYGRVYLDGEGKVSGRKRWVQLDCKPSPHLCSPEFDSEGEAYKMTGLFVPLTV